MDTILIRVVFIFFLLSTIVYALEPLRLSTIGDGVRTIGFEEIALTKEPIEEIERLEERDLTWQKSSHGIFGRVDSFGIVRLSLLNDTEDFKKIVLMHARPGIDKIDFWLLRKGKAVEHFVGGDRLSSSLRPIYAINSAFPLTLLAGEQVEIVAQLYTTGVLDANFEIKPSNIYEKHSKLQISWWGVFVGIMVILILYNLIHFFSTKEKSYLYHSFYAFFVSYVHLGVYGYIYFLGSEGYYSAIDVATYVATWFALMFRFIYPVVLFDLRKSAPRIATLLFLLSFLAFGVGLFFLFGLLDESILLAMKYFTLPLIMVLVVFLLLSFYFMYKKFAGAKLFFLGQLCAFLGATYSTIAVNTDLLGLSLQAAMFSSLLATLEVLFVTMTMGHRIERVIREKELLANINKLYEKYIYLGSYTSNVIHQWKAPLDQLGGLVSLMRAYKESDIKVDEKQHQRDLEELQTITNNLKKISKDIRNCLSSNIPPEIVNLQELIEQVLQYIGKDADSIQMTIISCDENIKINRAALLQILLVLLDNSIKIHKRREVANPQIKIAYKKEEKTITISDNAMGMESKISNNIFSPYKSGTESLGNGLFIAKKLAKERLYGDLVLVNTGKSGTTFCVSFGESL